MLISGIASQEKMLHKVYTTNKVNCKWKYDSLLVSGCLFKENGGNQLLISKKVSKSTCPDYQFANNTKRNCYFKAI